MPPKKNGFMVFTFEWKGKHGKHLSMRDATSQAGALWSNMSAQERGPYNERSKQNKNSSQKVEKLTCTGVPVALVEKEKQDYENRERQMKRQIETTVRNSVKNKELDVQSYFFIMANYFTKTLKNGVYVPAEISLAEYSLKEGVCRKYHSFINPGVTIYGHQYEAQHHSETTHKLPLPPNAMGDTNLGRIYTDVLDFIVDKETGEYPPIYTMNDCISIVDSVLDFLKADSAQNVDLKVFSIQYLFYIMKEATCELGEVEKIKSFYITDAYFERDFFEYQTGIACEYHEEIDKSKYCTQSCVTRWGFMFSDYMCRDIAISLIPGRHVPASTNLAAIINPAPSSVFSDTASFASMSSYRTKAMEEHKIYDDRTNLDSETFNNTADFPSLGNSRTRKNQLSTTATSQTSKATRISKDMEQSFHDGIHDSYSNPWMVRGRHVPGQPDTSHFSFDQPDNEDLSSVVSFGRGRAALNRSLNTTTASGAGRGTLFLP